MKNSDSDCWLKLAQTEDDREWLRHVTQNGQISLDRLPDVLDQAGVLRLLALLEQSPEAATPYDRKKAASAAREKSISAKGRELKSLPPVRDPERRRHCERNLLHTLQEYFPKSFHLEFSTEHLRVIAKIQTACFAALQQAIAMPRGDGKSTICRCASMWVALNGHHRFQMLLGANAAKAVESLDSIKFQLETNELLCEDYPEIIHPIRALNRIAQNGNGQTYQGKPTYINWSGDLIRFPVIPGSPGGGAITLVAGLQEAVRGANQFDVVTQTPLRPTFILLDDPSTRKSAESDEENNTREAIINGDLLGCAGPGKPMSVLMPCTVIRPNDVASRFLDRQRNPDWRGERIPMLWSLPTNMDLWQQYDTIRRRCLEEIVDDLDEAPDPAVIFAPCNKFYREHHAAMNEGAVVHWPGRKDPWMIDGLQLAMTLYFKNASAFFAEYQNDPLAAIETDTELLSEFELCTRLSGFDAIVVPPWATEIVAHIDCHKRILYFVISAFSPSFEGSIIHYGTYPKQSHPYFTPRTASPTIEQLHPGAGVEGALIAAVQALAGEIFKTPYRRTDGAKMKPTLVLVDAGWKRDPVFKACETFQGGNLWPAVGRRFLPDDTPLSACKPRAGETIGQEWTVPAVHGPTIRHVQQDANWWKTFAAARLSCPPTAPGALTLFGKAPHGIPDVSHQFFAQHLTAEYPTPAAGRKRTIEIWNPKPGSTQNHWWDNVVGCCVAASVAGARFLPPVTPDSPPVKKDRRFRRH